MAAEFLEGRDNRDFDRINTMHYGRKASIIVCTSTFIELEESHNDRYQCFLPF